MKTMTDEEIIALPIKPWVDLSGAVLAIWAVNPKLFDNGPFDLAPIQKCAGAWGATEFVTCLPWIKTLPHQSPEEVLDLKGTTGFWWRGVSETLTIWRVGKISRNLKNFPRNQTPLGLLAGDKENPESLVFYAPPGKIHSQKPLGLHEYYERAFPEAPKLEMFARFTRPGWLTIGGDLGFEITPRGVEFEL